MKEGKQKKLLILIVCIFLSLIGIIMTLTKNNTSTENEETSELSMQESEVNESTSEHVTEEKISEYDTTTLPDVDNDSDDSVNIYTTVYFTNTDILDSSSLPIEAHSVLVENADKFLKLNGYENVTELVVDNETFTDNDTRVDFNCFMEGHEEVLGVTFLKDTGELSFSIRKIDEYEL